MLVSESMAARMRPTQQSHVQAFSGSGTSQLLDTLADSPELLHNYGVIVLHVGTNNFGSKAEWKKFLAYQRGEMSTPEFESYLILQNCSAVVSSGELDSFWRDVNSLIGLMRMVNPSCIILLSAVIPRPWDHTLRFETVKLFNSVLQSFNKKADRIFYIPTCRPFINRDQSAKVDYFWWDGLHLSRKGLNVFKSFIFEKVDKAIRGFLC